MKLKDKLDENEIVETLTIIFSAKNLDQLLLDIRSYLIENDMDYVWNLHFFPEKDFFVSDPWQCRLTFFDAFVQDEVDEYFNQMGFKEPRNNR